MIPPPPSGARAQVLNTSSERTRMPAAGAGSEAVIAVEDLTFTYPRAARPAVAGLRFAIAPGEVFGFLGPSGAGKSTTQKILIGLLQGYRGRVLAFGRDLAT